MTRDEGERYWPQITGVCAIDALKIARTVHAVHAGGRVEGRPACSSLSMTGALSRLKTYETSRA
jgi:hypothetical protein